MGHIAYPNVATDKEGQTFKEICWRGRYLAAPADTPPGEGYTIAKYNGTTPKEVWLAIEWLVPESSTPTDKLVYEIRDAAPTDALGDSKGFAYVLAEISRWRTLKPADCPDDIWCTGVVEMKGGKPVLCKVNESRFKEKLQGFLDQPHDNLFLVPSSNIRGDHEPMLKEHSVDVLSVEQLKEGRIEQPPARKTIVRVRGDELPALVELLFEPPQELKQEIGPNPYRDLRAFREEDADLFFGRNTYIDRLVTAVQSNPLVAVIGASGSGKSSLVYAGLIPRLRTQGAWKVIDFRPGQFASGRNPLLSLAWAIRKALRPEADEVERLKKALDLAEDLKRGNYTLPQALDMLRERHPGALILLFADQFEELYTTCPESEEQHRFLDLLLQTSGVQTSVCRLIITIRADFMGKALAYRKFADALQDCQLNVGPMEREELRQAIEQPAFLQDVHLEDGLTERILEAVGAKPGELPLVQFALTELWKRQKPPAFGKPGWLTHAAYDALGGVEQALAGYAEGVYAGLDLDEQQRTQYIFTQLVLPGAGTGDTKRIATRTDIRKENWPLVTRLADTRLVVTGRKSGIAGILPASSAPTKERHPPDPPQGGNDACVPGDTVEVVHEALIRGWQRLREWIDADREFRMWQERLRSAMRQWKVSSYDNGALLRGALLAEAEQWQQEGKLAQEEQQFIQLSLELRDREKHEREARQQRELEWAQKAFREEQQRVEIERKAKKRSAVLAVIAIIVAIFAGFGFWQARQNAEIAKKNETIAEEQKIIAQQEKDKAEEQTATAIELSRRSSILGLVGFALQDDIWTSRGERPDNSRESRESRERAALLARLAWRVNKHFTGGVEAEIEKALRIILRTHDIEAGYGHATPYEDFPDLVCQRVHFTKSLTSEELEEFVGENPDEELVGFIVGNAACPDVTEALPFPLRSQPITTTNSEALSLNLNGSYPVRFVGNELKEHGLTPDTRFELQEVNLHESVVIDHATGLMWQQSGSDEGLTYAEAEEYIESLNKGEGFAGHTDWRLPTVEELMSLVEKEQSKEYFKLTEQSFKELKTDDDIPEDVVEMLKPLEDEEVIGEEKFLDAIKQHIGEEQTAQYNTLIQRHARTRPALYINPIFEIPEDVNWYWVWSADIRRTKDEGSAGSAWSVSFNYGDVLWDNLHLDYYVRAVRP